MDNYNPIRGKTFISISENFRKIVIQIIGDFQIMGGIIYNIIPFKGSALYCKECGFVSIW